MKKKNAVSDSSATSKLHRRAQTGAKQPAAAKADPPVETQTLRHQLHVHQIELEMQNDELRRAQHELEVARTRYFDLYNLAPVGYLALNESGLISEANLTAARLLGVDKSQLVKHGLPHFIIPDDQDIYYSYNRELVASGEPQEYELRMLKPDGSPFWVRLKASVSQNDLDAPVYRVTINDITESKKAERELARLASFPERNPNPIIELDLEGQASYLNPAARRILPTLDQEGLAHPWLVNWPELIRGFRKGESNSITREVTVGDQHYLQTLNYLAEIERVRIYGINITESKRAQEAFRESEEKYRNIIETTSEGVWVAHPDGKTLLVNQKMADMLGYSREELLGRVGAEFLIEKDRAAVPEKRAVIAKGESIQPELEFRRKDGASIWTIANVSPLHDNCGRHIATISMHTNITARKQAEAAVEAARIQAVNEKNRLQAVMQALPIGLAITNTQGGKIESNRAFDQVWGEARPETNSVHDYAYYRAWWVDTGEPVQPHEWASARAVKYGETVVGQIMEIQAFDGQRRFVLNSAAPVLDADVNIVGSAVAIQDITDLKQAEQDLENARVEADQRAAELNSIIEAMLDLVLVYDAAGNFVKSNTAAQRFTGQHENEPLLMQVNRFVARALGGDRVYDEKITVKHLAGSEVILAVSVSPIKIGEKIVGFVCLCHDITARERVNEELRQNREWLKVTISSIGDGVIAVDQQRRITFMNPVAAALTGWDPNAALGEPFCNVFQLVNETTHLSTEDILERVMLDRQVLLLANHTALVHRDGREIPIEDSAAPIMDAAGQVAGAVIVFHDVSEKRSTQKSLQASEERHRMALDAAHLGTWRHDIALNKIYLDAHARDHYRFDSDIVSIEQIFSCIHPEDRDRIQKQLDEALNSALSTETYITEYRVVYPDGTMRWLALSGRIVSEGIGTERRPVLVYGTSQDITDRKQAELIMHRAHDELEMRVRERTAELELERNKLKNILDAMKDGVSIINEQNVIEYVNPALEKEFGPSNGQKCFEYLHGQPILCAWCKNSPVFEGQTVIWESYFPKTAKTYELFNTPVRDANGIIANLQIFHDVTESKRVQIQVRENAERSQALNQMVSRLSAQRGLEATTQIISEEMAKIFNVPIVTLYLYDQARDVLYPARVHGMANDWAERLQSISRESHEKIKPMEELTIIPDLQAGADPVDRELYIALEARTHIQVNLEYADKLVGTLNLYTVGEQRQFTDNELGLLKSLGREITQAVVNATLFEAEAEARRIAEALQSANLLLTQNLNVDSVLETLLDSLAQMIPYDGANVMLLNSESQLVVRAGRGYAQWTDPEKTNDIVVDPQSNAIAQTIFSTRASVLLPDTAEENHGFSLPGVEHGRNWLGVPLIAGGNVIGIYALDKVIPRFFTDQHRKLAEALAPQAAVAIQNAWLFEQAAASREQMQSLSRRLVQVQETERRYVARELHDEAGQLLTGLKFGLRVLEQEAHSPELVSRHVAELGQVVEDVLQNLHRLAMDLRPATLDQLGLIPALDEYIEAMRVQSGLSIEFESVGFNAARLPSTIEIAIYRFVQEALTNIVRHAQATRVQIILERSTDRVKAVVDDDGVGFDPKAMMQMGQLGLLGMQERIEMLAGTLTIESQAKEGTTLIVEVPCGDSNSDRG